MGLSEQINKDFIESYKSKDEAKVSLLRMLKSSLKNAEIAKKGELLTTDEEIAILKKEAKQRKESIEAFKNGGKPEMAEKEEAELKMIETYLPEQLSEDQIRQIVKDTITESGISDMGKMGQLIGLVMGKTKGLADGGMVSKIVREELQ